MIHEAAACEAVYLSCFRNYSALTAYLSERHPRVAIIGAGSKGEFREEDQIVLCLDRRGIDEQGLRAGGCANRVIS